MICRDEIMKQNSTHIDNKKVSMNRNNSYIEVDVQYVKIDYLHQMDMF